MREIIGVVGFVGALGSGCMSTRLMLTDYDDRTSAQAFTAFLVDAGVGAALIGTSFLIGEDGRPEPWTLSAGALSATFGLVITAALAYPPEPTPPTRRTPPPDESRRP